jgi:hypothetical protein
MPGVIFEHLSKQFFVNFWKIVNVMLLRTGFGDESPIFDIIHGTLICQMNEVIVNT